MYEFFTHESGLVRKLTVDGVWVTELDRKTECFLVRSAALFASRWNKSLLIFKFKSKAFWHQMRPCIPVRAELNPRVFLFFIFSQGLFNWRYPPFHAIIYKGKRISWLLFESACIKRPRSYTHTHIQNGNSKPFKNEYELENCSDWTTLGKGIINVSSNNGNDDLDGQRPRCYCGLSKLWVHQSETESRPVRLLVTPWAIQSTEFSRPEHWSGSLSLLQRIFPTQGSNPGLPHCRRILYQLSHKGSQRSVWSPGVINLCVTVLSFPNTNAFWKISTL